MMAPYRSASWGNAGATMLAVSGRQDPRALVRGAGAQPRTPVASGAPGHDDDRSAHQQTIVIVVEAVGRRGRFRAHLDGRVIVAASTQPFLDAARILIASGCDPGAVLEMRHQGKTAFAMRGPLRVGARFDVKDARFVGHRPRPDGHDKVDASFVDTADEP
jgi:hypothetical protein